MKRQYYISNDLSDLKKIEHELTTAGLTTPQFHVLSENDAEVEKHHLHAIESVLKKDVVRSTKLGALYGAVIAAIVLMIDSKFVGQGLCLFSGINPSTDRSNDASPNNEGMDRCCDRSICVMCQAAVR